MTSSTENQSHNFQPKGGLVFVWTVVESVQGVTLPLEVTPAIRFDHTAETHTEAQRSFLSGLGLRGPSRFEVDLRTMPTPGGGSSTEFVPLTPSNFRYYSFQFEGWAPPSFHVELVASIMDPPLHFSHHVYTSEPFGIGEPLGRGHQIHFPRAIDEGVVGWRSVSLNAAYFNLLRELLYLYTDLVTKHELVANSTRIFRDLANVPPRHSLRFLGLIAVLECVLCHKPEVGENADSLGHQIRTKLNLLASRPGAAIPKIENVALEKTWSRLYEFRSRIAHGDTATFPIKNLPFKNVTDVVDFAEATCRAVLRQLLLETDLVLNLRGI